MSTFNSNQQCIPLELEPIKNLRFKLFNRIHQQNYNTSKTSIVKKIEKKTVSLHLERIFLVLFSRVLALYLEIRVLYKRDFTLEEHLGVLGFHYLLKLRMG